MTVERRNEIWDALAAVVGWEPERGDRAGEKRFGKAVRDIKAIEGATGPELRARAARFRSIWPGIRLTPEALVKHWSACAPPPRPAATRPPVDDEDPNELYAQLRGGPPPAVTAEQIAAVKAQLGIRNDHAPWRRTRRD
jgi:hypothetical protein